jgi:hypothetical protein
MQAGPIMAGLPTDPMRAMQRRSCLALAAGALIGPGAASGQTMPSMAPEPAPASAPRAPGAGALPRLAVLDFELIDDQNNPLTKAAQEVRLRKATQQLQQELAERRLYDVVDPAPSAALQGELRSQQAFLYRCDDCADQVGALLGVDLVMGTWVQKVSELILNLNVQVYARRRRQVVFSKSVDMRSNDDVSWTRAVRYLVRDMVDKRAANPRYGM